MIFRAHILLLIQQYIVDTPHLQPPAAEPNTFFISISNFAKFRFLDIKTQFHVQINSICIRRLTISVKLKLHNSNMHPQSIFYGGPDSHQAEADIYVLCHSVSSC